MRRAAVLAGAVLTAGALASEPSSYDIQQWIETIAVASPYKLSSDARRGTIRYRIALDDGATWDWPETAEQHVVADSGIATITICADCGREPAPTPEQIAAYLQPNPWVDSDDPRIRGGIYVSCVARGEALFGDAGLEMELIKANLGEFPLVGFYANGEIARDTLYGYTGVLTLFI